MRSALHRNAVLWRGNPLQEGRYEYFISRITQPQPLVLAMTQRTLARLQDPKAKTVRYRPPDSLLHFLTTL